MEYEDIAARLDKLAMKLDCEALEKKNTPESVELMARSIGVRDAIIVILNMEIEEMNDGANLHR